MPDTLDISDWEIQSSTPIRDGNYPHSTRPLYTPLVAEDFESGTPGNTYSPGFWAVTDATSEFNTVRSFDGSQSMRVRTDPGEPPVSCGGQTFFGGSQDLPVTIPVGKRLWFRFKAYFPSAFSWGYTFQSSDSAEAATCSQPSDGFGSLKFMRISPVTGTSRVYMEPPVSRRSVTKPATNSIVLVSEAGSTLELTDDAGELSLDEWQDLQIEILVDDTSSGYVRYWRNGVFIGELTGATVVGSGNALKGWGIGNYWNGVPYTDDSGDDTRRDFWIDEVICATDVDGYGAPNGTDAGDRTYIDPLTLVSDF